MALPGLVLRLLGALVLWPLAFGLALAFGHLVLHLPWLQGQLAWFLAGFAAYLAVQIFWWRPLFLYVMGHELTHALASVLQGGSADDMSVSTKGGKVMVNRDNFVVNLAPYCFPIYTALACLVWAVAADRFRPLLGALVGFTLAFHFALTLYSLRQHQSDIAQVGWLFALPFIVSVNLAISVLVLRLLSPARVGLGAYCSDAGSILAASARWLRSLL